MTAPSFVCVLGSSPEDLHLGRPQVRDLHLKFEDRGNVVCTAGGTHPREVVFHSF